MAQTSGQIRVKSGVPWWLWLLLLVVGGSVLIATVISLLPDDPEYQFQQGLSAFDQGDRAGLLQAVSQLRGRPDYQQKQQLLEGLELMATSRPLKAIPLLQSAADGSDPAVRIKALTYLAQSLAQADQRLQAVEVLRTAVNEASDNPRPRAVLGGILYELGAYREAMQEFAKLKSAEGKERVMAERLLGEMLMDQGDYGEAAKEFQAALKSDPVNPANSAQALKLVRCLLEVQEYSLAEEWLEDVEPSPEKEAIKAEIQFRTGNVADASRTLQAASASSQEGFAGPVQTALKVEALISATEDAAKALKTLNRLRESIPAMTRDAEFYQAMAGLARAAEQPEEADLYEQNQQQLQEIRGEYLKLMATVVQGLDDTAGRIRLGDLAAEIGDYGKAEAWYSTAKKIDPSLANEVGIKLQRYIYGMPELTSTARFRTSADAVDGEPKAE